MMQEMDDRELKNLLREWKAPNAPGTVTAPKPPARKPWWTWLWTGSIRIPVPVGIAVVVLAAYWAYTASTIQAPGIDATPEFAVPVVSLADFQPVEEVDVRIVGEVK